MGEVDVERDMTSVAVALERATENGLQVEFVLWFGYAMQGHTHKCNVQLSVAEALREWDL